MINPAQANFQNDPQQAQPSANNASIPNVSKRNEARDAAARETVKTVDDFIRAAPSDIIRLQRRQILEGHGSPKEQAAVQHEFLKFQESRNTERNKEKKQEQPPLVLTPEELTKKVNALSKQVEAQVRNERNLDDMLSELAQSTDFHIGRKIDGELMRFRGTGWAAVRSEPGGYVVHADYGGPFAVSITTDDDNKPTKVTIKAGRFRYGNSGGDVPETTIDALEYDDGSAIAYGNVFVCCNAGGNPFFFCSKVDLDQAPWDGVSCVVRLASFQANKVSNKSELIQLTQTHFGNICVARYEGQFSTLVANDGLNLYFNTGQIVYANLNNVTAWDSDNILRFVETSHHPGTNQFFFLTVFVYSGGVLSYSLNSKTQGDTGQDYPPPLCIGMSGGTAYGPPAGPKVFSWYQHQYGPMYVPVLHDINSYAWQSGYFLEYLDT